MIRVAGADDHPMVRRGLSSLIESTDNMLWVGEATEGDGAIALCDQTRVDVMLLDLRMPGRDSADVIGTLSRRNPPVHVIVFTTFCNEETVLKAMRAGARGYLTKGSSDTQLLSAIQRVATNSRVMSEEIADTLALAMLATPLTRRENDILHNVAKGYSNKVIARRLGISPGTVKTHVQSILEKLGCEDRTGAVVEAQRRGLVEFRE